MIYANAVVTPATDLKVEDFCVTGRHRVARVKFDGLSIDIGGNIFNSDEAIIASGELLIAAVRTLVDSARQRIADAEEPNEPDGPPDSYWQPVDDSAYRRDMRDAGRGAQVA